MKTVTLINKMTNARVCVSRNVAQAVMGSPVDDNATIELYPLAYTQAQAKQAQLDTRNSRLSSLMDEVHVQVDAQLAKVHALRDWTTTAGRNEAVAMYL